MKKLFLLCTLAFCSAINAQTSKSPWAVDLNLNFREYSGDLGYQLFSFKDGNAQPGIGVSRYINPWLNVRAFANYGASDFTATNPIPTGVNNRLLINSTNLGLHGIFKLNNGFILKEEALVAPFFRFRRFFLELKEFGFWWYKKRGICCSSNNWSKLSGPPTRMHYGFNVLQLFT